MFSTRSFRVSLKVTFKLSLMLFHKLIHILLKDDNRDCFVVYKNKLDFRTIY